MKNDIKSTISRRRFLSNSALAAFSFHFVPSHVLGANPPSNKLNIAGIGIGGMGGGNLRQCERENIVALCDVDSKYAGKTFKRYPKAKAYKDYRVMFDKQKDIDAVVIATPDHTHAVITMEALKRGKHVYCQKPLTHTVYEARKITEAARKYKVQTQMGNQGHSSEQIRLLKEWLADGAIGDVTEVYAWTDRPVGGNVWSDFAVRARPKETPPVPESLDWDLWLGPVAYRPYHPEYHPLKWRAWLDFGTGALGDMGCHIIVPETRMREYKRPEKTIPRVKTGHEGDWLRACKDGKPASSNFEYGGALAEMILLGMVAIRAKDRNLVWDAENLKFKNNDAANELLHIKYRDGWHL